MTGWLLGACAGAAALAQPMVAKLVMESLGRRRSLAGPVALLAALTVAAALLSAASAFLVGRAAESVVLTARQGLTSRLLRLQVARWIGSNRVTCCPGSPRTPHCFAPSPPTGLSTRSTASSSSSRRS